MADRHTLDIQALQKLLTQFANERDWDKFHTPKNIAMALAGEAGEFLELFQWLTPEESWKVMSDAKEAEKVRDELADIVIYAMRFAGLLDIDVPQAIQDKMKKNAAKYPVHLAKGKATKYTELGDDT